LGKRGGTRDALTSHERKPPSSAHSLICWRTCCRMLTNRAIVATQGCIGCERASANRFSRRMLEPHLSRPQRIHWFPCRLVRRWSGRRGMTSGGYLQ
jgi:hypothetical protein